MLHPVTTTRFEKDCVRQHKRGKELSKLKEIMARIVREEALPSKIGIICSRGIGQSTANVMWSPTGC